MDLLPNTIDDFGYLCIENLYDEDELVYIWNEISNLDYILDVSFDDKDKKIYADTHNGKDDQGISKMSGFGITLDTLYEQRQYSPILTLNRKLFSPIISSVFMETHPANSCYDTINEDFSLLNKYFKDQQYTRHRDSSSFSAITFFSRNKIEGGELNFSDYNINFECKNNSCIIFPSWVQHNSNKVKSEDRIRYSLAQFMVIRYWPPQPHQLKNRNN